MALVTASAAAGEEFAIWDANTGGYSYCQRNRSYRTSGATGNTLRLEEYEMVLTSTSNPARPGR